MFQKSLNKSHQALLEKPTQTFPKNHPPKLQKSPKELPKESPKNDPKKRPKNHPKSHS